MFLTCSIINLSLLFPPFSLSPFLGGSDSRFICSIISFMSRYVSFVLFLFHTHLCIRKTTKNVKKLHCFLFVRWEINDTTWHKNDSDFSFVPFLLLLLLLLSSHCVRNWCDIFSESLLFECEWRITSSTDLHPITLSLCHNEFVVSKSCTTVSHVHRIRSAFSAWNLFEMSAGHSQIIHQFQQCIVLHAM